MPIMIGNLKKKLMSGGHKISKMYCQNEKIYSSGNNVDYHLSNIVYYTEEFEDGEDVLTPKTFTPSRPGWIFQGWRETIEAISTVLTSKIMGDDPITLYGVFKKLITLKVYNNSTTATEETGYIYYNNANVQNPKFTVVPAEKSSWDFLGWTKDTNAHGSVSYASITDTEFSEDTTLYGKYAQNVTLSYNGNGSTGGNTSSQTLAKLYNTSGDSYTPRVTINNNGFTRDGYTFQNWALGKVDGNTYTPNTLFELSNNATMYALWLRDTAVLFERTETSTYCDYRWHGSSSNSWKKMTCYTNTNNSVVATWNEIDCTDYNYCTVRINGSISSTPSGNIADHTYIKIGFTTNHSDAIRKVDDENLVHKWASTEEGNIGSGTEGLAYKKWYDLTIDVSELTGVQTLNAFIGGANNNVGTLHCSKITMHN